MTNQEKKLNRDDLLAFKTYDKTQYAMVPGARIPGGQKIPSNYNREANATPS